MIFPQLERRWPGCIQVNSSPVKRSPRFLLVLAAVAVPCVTQTSAPTQINLVLNWSEELKKKVPVK